MPLTKLQQQQQQPVLRAPVLYTIFVALRERSRLWAGCVVEYSTMDEDLPFRAEYAKSGRAGCKLCKNNIAKDELRLAVMVQSPMFDGKVPNWFHFSCFFTRQKVKNAADIAHFNSLRWEDQQKIKDKIAGGSKGPAAAKHPKALSDLDDFSTEYAKSSRSACRGCEQKIEKGAVRISKKDYESQKAKMFGPVPQWYHIDCFVKEREELEYYDAADKLPGFFTLGVDDQKELKSKLKKIEGKRKAESEPEVPAKKQKTDNQEEKKLKKQNDLIFKYHDWLKKNLSKAELQELLEINDQDIPKGESRILDLLADCLAFGALQKCPECKEGQLSFRDDGYYCKGNISGWTNCSYSTKDPKRKAFVISDELKEHSLLKKYKSAVGKRLFPSNHEPSKPSSSNAEPGKKKESDKVLPLENLKIAVAGKLSKTPKELAKIVEELGGCVVSAIDESVACVISNQEEVEKNSKKIKNAKKANVHVVAEKFLDDVKNGGASLMIAQHNLCTWGGDPTFKITAFAASKSKKSKSLGSEAFFTKSVPDKLKLTVKGAAAVDPDSELEDVAHVLEESGSVYNAVLNMVDVSKGTNSYYKLQVLEHDKKHSYWVFRSWGRIGTTIGGSKCEDMESKSHAISEFKRLYEEKTGNAWENRKNFVKYPNRFYPLDIDYGQESESENLQKLKPGSKSKLPKVVQELICLIFDVESMKKAMVQFELDLKKMPLGKISKQQIQHAYSVLTEAQQLLEKGESQVKVLDVSNRFYTLIPHDFGMKKPPLLDTEEIIKSKMDMLESLLEIEIAYNLLKEANEDKELDPIDHHYHQLKTDIAVLDKSTEEYSYIEKYLKNTHAETHRMYSLNIDQVFKISRHGEEKRYKPFKRLHNRYLLWHGSRLTNFAGILSQGLRIAPPEAPCTGYMFGKGIYFADMVSKSANYCYTGADNPYGLMLLCEVALGNMYERTDSDYITKLPTNKHSTKGVGATMPDPNKSVTLPCGTVIPLGKPKPTKIESSLLYNEYIVYDVAQVNIKYLLKVKFDWNY